MYNMGYNKGNKFALGNNGGRPPVFNSAEELEGKISEYFDTRIPECDSENNIIKKNNPTVTGLALYLGYSSRQSIYDNIEKDKFSYILKRALLVIENGYEESLLEKSPTGSIFALKNMGWRDERTVDNKSSDGSMKTVRLSAEAAKAISDKIDDEV